MTPIEILILVSILWNILGFLVLIDIGITADWAQYCDGFELLNPIFIYRQLRVNYFGAFWVTLFMNALCPIVSLGYWFYKLCIVGRR